MASIDLTGTTPVIGKNPGFPLKVKLLKGPGDNKAWVARLSKPKAGSTFTVGRKFIKKAASQISSDGTRVTNMFRVRTAGTYECHTNHARIYLEVLQDGSVRVINKSEALIAATQNSDADINAAKVAMSELLDCFAVMVDNNRTPSDVAEIIAPMQAWLLDAHSKASKAKTMDEVKEAMKGADSVGQSMMDQIAEMEAQVEKAFSAATEAALLDDKDAAIGPFCIDCGAIVNDGKDLCNECAIAEAEMRKDQSPPTDTGGNAKVFMF